MSEWIEVSLHSLKSCLRRRACSELSVLNVGRRQLFITLDAKGPQALYPRRAVEVDLATFKITDEINNNQRTLQFKVVMKVLVPAAPVHKPIVAVASVEVPCEKPQAKPKEEKPEAQKEKQNSQGHRSAAKTSSSRSRSRQTQEK